MSNHMDGNSTSTTTTKWHCKQGPCSSFTSNSPTFPKLYFYHFPNQLHKQIEHSHSKLNKFSIFLHQLSLDPAGLFFFKSPCCRLHVERYHEILEFPRHLRFFCRLYKPCIHVSCRYVSCSLGEDQKEEATNRQSVGGVSKALLHQVQIHLKGPELSLGGLAVCGSQQFLADRHHVCGQKQAEVVIAAETMELLMKDWLQRVKDKLRWASLCKPWNFS